MRLDTPTLFLMTVVVTFAVGVLFLLSWVQNRSTRALAIWGVAHVTGAAASALLSLRTLIPDSLSIGLANALMLGAYGLIWSGVRRFEGRDPAYGKALAGGVLWIAACLVPDFYASLPARIVLASTLAGLYCALCAHEIWQARTEPLMSRYSALVLMAAYAGLYFLRVPLALMTPMPVGRTMDSPWLAILCFAGTLFTVAIAFVLMALTKERAEREQRLAAQTDPLTGTANRRAFVAGAERHLSERAGPVSLLLCDLDHFKSINDTYGHAVGDGALIAFCHVTEALLPKRAGLGRMGGEEFACLLPGFRPDEAGRVAERIRAAVAAIAVPGYPRLAIRVSIGVAGVEHDHDTGIDALLRRADDALYRAKAQGRDRVARDTGAMARPAAWIPADAA